MSLLTAVVAQVLLTCNAPGSEPLRFGFPLPQASLESGLRVTGAAGVALQWRALQSRPDPVTGRVWVELCLAGGSGAGRVRLVAGGTGPVDPAAGPVVRLEETRLVEGDREVETRRWRWACGVVDVVRRVRFLAAQEYEGESYAAGEYLTLAEGEPRFLQAGIRASAWRRAGVLPRGGSLGRDYRRRLLATLPRLVEGLTLRDRGDYTRSQGVTTNLEFDMTRAFARLGLAEDDPGCLTRAWRSAVHSADHDLDPASGLLFQHGKGHRVGRPDPGHTWLGGLLLVGCLAAEEPLIDAACCIARGLARHPSQGEDRADRVRDSGWPLLEMESWLRHAEDPEVEGAVQHLVRRVKKRFDAGAGLFRFGEGVQGKGVYEDPLWVAAGCLLPGLRAHVLRTGDAEVGRMLRRAERRLADLVRNGKPGLPVRTWTRGAKVLGQARLSGVPPCFMVLEGLPPRDVSRYLRRRQVARALEDVPDWEDPDLATSFAMVGRCLWIYR